MKESIVLLTLGACWAGYLAWYWRENKKSSYRRSDGIRAFSSGLGTLGGSATRSQVFSAGAASVLAPRSAQDAARRRREVLIALVAAAVLTFLGAIAVGGAAVFLHVVVDLALASYAYALVQRRNDEAEREIKVHMLYPERVVREPAVVRPREAVNS